MIFSFKKTRLEQQQFTAFLGELLESLKNEDSVNCLECLYQALLSKNWAWLSRYNEISSWFFGFHVDANTAVDDLRREK